MDTHFKGPRADNGYGAAVTQAIARAVVGTTPNGTHLILRTEGATPDKPIHIRIFGQILETFDAGAAVFTIQQSDVNGENPEALAELADFTDDMFSSEFFLIEDKQFDLIFAGDEGSDDADFTDGVTNEDNTLASAAANFTAIDEGKGIVGDGIPAGTTILTVTDEGNILLSADTTATATGTAFTIVDREPADPGTTGQGYVAFEIAGPGHPSIEL